MTIEFGEAEVSTFQKLALERLALPVDDISSYFEQWPGDEDDEQVFAALKELA